MIISSNRDLHVLITCHEQALFFELTLKLQHVVSETISRLFARCLQLYLFEKLS